MFLSLPAPPGPQQPADQPHPRGPGAPPGRREPRALHGAACPRFVNISKALYDILDLNLVRPREVIFEPNPAAKERYPDLFDKGAAKQRGIRRMDGQQQPQQHM